MDCFLTSILYRGFLSHGTPIAGCFMENCSYKWMAGGAWSGNPHQLINNNCTISEIRHSLCVCHVFPLLERSTHTHIYIYICTYIYNYTYIYIYIYI